MEDRSLELIGLIGTRPARLASFGYGIRTAADHVRGVVGCMGDELCSALKLRDAPAMDPRALLKESESRLVYANEEMKYEPPVGDVDGWFKAAKIDRPPRTLAVVELIVTTPQEDRDGDILRTEGAVVDQSMPSLWHHMLPMPVGRMVSVLEHNAKRLKVAGAIMDSPLGADTIHLIEFGALRISHGFKPLEFKPRQAPEEKASRDGTVRAMPGFDVLKFEIMEFSFVTVPSNVSAVITAFSRGKLHDPFTKAWAAGLADQRPCVVRGITLPGPDGRWEVNYTLNSDQSLTVGTGGAMNITKADHDDEGEHGGEQGSGGMAAMEACAKACEKCAEACQECVEDNTEANCKKCAAACEACAKKCDACGLDECEACAEACRKCAEACKAGPSDECVAACKACIKSCKACMDACHDEMEGMKSAEPWDDSKPFAGEHSARLKEPGAFDKDSFRRQNNKFGAGIHAIFGKLKGEDKMTLQAIRFDAQKFSAAEAKKWLSAHEYKAIAFEPASAQADGEEKSENGKVAPTRWNKSFSKSFDVASEYLEPSRLEYDWVSRFIGCQVKELFHNSCVIPAARMGSFLTGLRHILAECQVDDVRNIAGGRGTGEEEPPRYEVIQLNSTTTDDFMVDGITFYTGFGTKFAVNLMPDWRGLRMVVYTSYKRKDLNRKIIADTWAWAKENNFLKGEAFSLCGEFLPKTTEGWGDVFLTAKNVGPIKRVVQQLNSKGAALPNRGMMFLGPPGTGKTLSGRIIRNEANATFVWVSARDFYYVGAIGGMTYAFDLAKELAPSVLFIEDVDNWLSASAVDVLKTEMDGIGRSTGVVTILTTNYPERMPSTLIDRPGRFHDVLRFDLPDAKLRQLMIGKWLPEAGGAAVVATVQKTTGYSGAHIYELCHFARTLAEEEGVGIDKALSEAVLKVEEQRSLIDDAQLVGSRYKPGKEFGARWIKSIKSEQQEESPSSAIAELKADEMEAMELFSWFLTRSTAAERLTAMKWLGEATDRDKRAKRRRALQRFLSPVR